MNYNIGKQLKDAGFSFIPIQVDREIVTGKSQVYSGFVFDGKEFYAPTLSELIEACGEDFWELQRLTVPPYPRWYAEAKFPNEYNDGIASKRVDGLTAEEAVAKLWLALQR
jgi:hypothetical protein